ncbi:MAG: TRAP transporter small permease [Spirochaetes bacterium]|nr:TRAP transporter small permease [Spirochaetota bacterium]
MKKTKGFSAAFEILSAVLEVAITVFFFAILALTIVLVILRYGFNETIIGGNEVMEYLFIYTTAIGAAVALGRREHIKITWFVDKLSRRARPFVDVLGFLFIAFINAVMIVYSIPWIRTVGGFESPVLRLPNRTIQLIIPIGCGLVILYCLYHILNAITDGSGTSKEGTA